MHSPFRWLKTLFAPRRARTIQRHSRLQLIVEELENRVVPTTYTWTGADVSLPIPNTNWSDANNWLGGIAPTAGAPVQLVFNSSAVSLTGVDDISGLVANQITFSTGGFDFSASPGVKLTLADPSSSTASIIVNGGAANVILRMDIVLGTSADSTEKIEVQPAASLQLTGKLSGNSATNLTKTSVGTLTLSGDNSGFAGPFTINNSIGNSAVVITNANGLGAPLTSEVQVLTISNAVPGTTQVTLTYSDGITNPSTSFIYQGDSTDAGTIQTKLNTLFAGLGFTGSPVSVAAMPTAGKFAINFGGTMKNIGVLQLNASATGPASAFGTTLADGGAPNVTTINVNTQLQVNVTPSNSTVPNSISVAGAGTDNVSGAIVRTVTGTVTLAGNIVFTGSTTIGGSGNITVTGTISEVTATSVFNLTKEGQGLLYLNPIAPASAANNFQGGNTYHGNTNVNTGILQIGQPFALGAGGATTFIHNSLNGTGNLNLRYTSSASIPSQYLNYAVVQQVTLTNPVINNTKFTLSFNGATTLPITYTGTVTDRATIQSALNGLSTIGGFNGSVVVTQTGTTFNVTFGGTLGGMTIATMIATVTSPFGTGSASVAVTSGNALGQPAIGFKVPNEYLNVEINGNVITQGNDYDTWEQPSANSAPYALTLSNCFIGASLNSTFVINGKITGSFDVANGGSGRVALTAVNALTSNITLLDGTLNLRDSNALGTKNFDQWPGTTLELQADGIPDSSGLAGTYDLYFPSTQTFKLTGIGHNNEGALYNWSGSNKFEGRVILDNSSVNKPDSPIGVIGVATDPDPNNVQHLTANILSQLTIDGVVSSQGNATIGHASPPLRKIGFGELVLTAANTYTIDQVNAGINTFQTFINQGWITIQNNLALGTLQSNYNPLDQPGVQVLSGAALVLKQDLDGNNLTLSYPMNLAGTGFAHRNSWLNNKGALINLDGANIIVSDITLNDATRTTGIGVEIDGGNDLPFPNVSQLTIAGNIYDGATAGQQVVKFGSQRLIIQGQGLYTGGVDIQQGVVLIRSDSALGTGTPSVNVTTTVEPGAALEFGTTLPGNTGGVQRGLQVWYNKLVLNGGGNPEFGDAPLMVEANDNIWRGPIVLSSNITVTFDGPGAAETPVPTMLTTVASPGGGTVATKTVTTGATDINAVQTLTFSSMSAGDTFTLVVSNGTTTAQTNAIPWSASTSVLIASIQKALDDLSSMYNLFSAGLRFAEVALLGPAINIFPNSRLIATGTVSDGANPADLTIDGGGELNLAGSNTYRGITHVDEGLLTIQNSNALGAGGTSQVQTLTLNSATPNVTKFNLSFGGYNTPGQITYTGSPADAVNVRNALNALQSIGGVSGSVSVSVDLTDATSPVFTITLGGGLAGFAQGPVTAPSVTNGSATQVILSTGTGGTIVADGAQLQLQGGVNVVGEPLILQGKGNPLASEVQQVSITGSNAGTFQLTFTNPTTSVTSTTPSLPIGASAAQVQATLNAMPSIYTGGGSVFVTRNGLNVYTIVYRDAFAGQSQPWSTQSITPVALPTSHLLFTTDNGTQSFVQEYTSDGALVRSIPIPNSPIELSHQPAGDIAQDASGKIYVYNGISWPALAIYDPATSSWSQYTFSGWNHTNTAGYGAIAVSGNYVFLSDQLVGSDASGESGIVRFDLTTSTFQRFQGGQDIRTLTIGLDGNLYAFDGGTQLFVFDPTTMGLLRTITLPSGHDFRGIAVDVDGGIFAGDFPSRTVYHFDSNGVEIKNVNLVGFPGGSLSNLTSLSIDANGTIIVGAGGGTPVAEMSSALTNVKKFDLPTNSGFLNFGAPVAAQTFGLGFTGYSNTKTVTISGTATSAATMASLQAALNQLLLDPLGPGGGAGTATVTRSASGDAFLVKFDGTLADVSVPLLVITPGTGSAAVSYQHWLTAASAQQALSVSGVAGAQVDLGFIGVSPVHATLGATPAATLAALQTAMDTLMAKPISPGSGNGTALVELGSAGNYLITFGGSLYGVSVPLLVATGLSGGGGAGAVLTGASISIGDIVQGGTTYAAPTQWFSSGPSPVANAAVNLGSGLPANIAGPVTSIKIDPSEKNLIYITTANGGSWKSTNGGQSWTPLFDSLSAVQSFDVTGSSPGADTYALTYTDPFTGKVSTTNSLPFNATGDQLQSALNALMGFGNSVSVTQTLASIGSSSTQQLVLNTTSSTWTPVNTDPVRYTRFQLLFNGVSTADIAYTGIPVQDAINIQTALNAPGVLPPGGSAVVNVQASSGDETFAITLQGSLALSVQPMLGFNIGGPLHNYWGTTAPSPFPKINSQAPSGTRDSGSLTGTTGAGPRYTNKISFSGGNLASVSVAPLGVTFTGNTSVFGLGIGAFGITSGSGYTAPVVTINPILNFNGTSTGGTGATAIASGGVTGVSITAPGFGYTTPPIVTFSGGGGSGAAGLAVIDSFGRVTGVTITNPGSGYTSPPTVNFASGVYTTPAAATTSLSITKITVLTPGSGYTIAPNVTISDPTGTGATAVASILTSGLLSSIDVTSGSGYATNPAASFTGGGSGASGYGTISGGIVSGTVTAPGTNYTNKPTVTVLGGGGTNGTVQPQMSTGITAINITAVGSGYTVPPNVVIGGAPGSLAGSGATAHAVLTGTTVTSIVVDNPGQDYSPTSPPTITLVPVSGGSGATAVAVVRATLTGITVNDGYVHPRVSISGGNPTTPAVGVAVGGVTNVFVFNSGTGFTVAPQVVFDPPTGPGTQRTARGVANINAAGNITDIIITDPGAGYTDAPGCHLIGPGAGSEVLTVLLSITGVDFSTGSAGAGYVSPPTITFFDTLGGLSTSASAYPALNASGAISQVIITSGFGYTSTPTLSITGGGAAASGAVATAKLAATVTSAVKVTPGTGYSATTTVTFPDPFSPLGPGGTRATAYDTLEIPNTQTGTNANLAMTGGSVAIDPTDRNHIFYATGNANISLGSYYGSGVYESTDGGQTWTLLIDPSLLNSPVPGNPLYGLTINKILLDTTAPATLYVATSDLGTNAIEGTGTNNAPALHNPGVWRYTLGSKTWVNLTNITSAARTTGVSALGAANPKTPGPDDNFTITFPQKDTSWTDIVLANGVLYAALGKSTGDPLNGVYHLANPATVNTGNKLPAWMVGNGAAPDNRASNFPFSVANGTIRLTATVLGATDVFANIATAGGTARVTGGSWVNGAPSNPSFATLTVTPNFFLVGQTVTISGISRSAYNGTFVITAVTATTITYVENVDPQGPAGTGLATLSTLSGFSTVTHTTTSGTTWSALAALPPAIYLGNNAGYASAFTTSGIVGRPLYAGGTDLSGNNYIYMYNGSWNSITADATGAAPHSNILTMTVSLDPVTNLDADLYVGTDGGIWRYNLATSRWFDLNGNLSNIQFTSLASDPTNPNRVLGTGTGIGIVQFGGNQSWTQLAGLPFSLGGNGTLNSSSIAIDPNNPRNIYEFQQAAPGALTSLLVYSRDGGVTWQKANVNTSSLDGVVVIDKLSRVFAGGSISPMPSSSQSTNLQVVAAGTVNPSWQSLNTSLQVSAIAVAELQGPFVGDSDFPDVTDLGATSPDPNTIYITDGTAIQVTKNFGSDWQDVAAIPGFVKAVKGPEFIFPYFPTAFNVINDIKVDPRNRDILYAVVGGSVGLIDTGTVWQSTDAGKTWTNISAGLPSSTGITSIAVKGGSGYLANPVVTISAPPAGGVRATAVAIVQGGVVVAVQITNPGSGYTSQPTVSFSAPTGLNPVTATGTVMYNGAPAWELVIDPRTNNLYLGADDGVWSYAPGAAAKWIPFGYNLPNVAVHALDLNQTTNILTAGTYGRGAFQFFLDTPSVNSGALYAASGADIWNGPIILAGSTTINASGAQTLQNGVSVAQLTILGSISDQRYIDTQNAANTLTKIGGGNVTLAATTPSTFGGTTLIREGNLITQTPSALGGSGVAGTQELFLDKANVGATTFTLTFNGSTTGPLFYTADSNADAIAIAAALNDPSFASIGGLASPGSVTVIPNGPGVFLIMFGGSLTGITQPMIIGTITSGVGRVYSVTAGGTVVSDGSVLQLNGSLAGEPLFLFGNGTLNNGHWSGALENVSGNNTYTGTITLENDSTIGVDPSTSLTIAAASPGAPGITDLGGATGMFSFTKEGTGTLLLASANAYELGTFVNQGVVNIQNSNALGAAGTTTVLDMAQLQLQQAASGPVNVTNQNLVLSGAGPFNTGALYNVNGSNTWGSATTNVIITSATAFSPQTTPSGTVAINVANLADNLTIASPIIDSTAMLQSPTTPARTLAAGLVKIGLGKLTLAANNTYLGTTYIQQGIVVAQQSNSLGAANNDAIQRLTVIDPAQSDTFKLTINGVQTTNNAFRVTPSSLASKINAILGPNSVTVDLNEVYSGISEVQTITLTDATPNGTKFKLKIAGSSNTGIITYTGNATNDANAIQTALNIVLNSTQAPWNGTSTAARVTVTPDSTGTIFTVTFGGALSDQPVVAIIPTMDPTSTGGLATVQEVHSGFGAPTDIYTITFSGPLVTGKAQPLISVQPSAAGMTTAISVVAEGGASTIVSTGAALYLDGAPSGGSITIPSRETLVLNGSGAAGQGVLRNITGLNTLNGAVVLQSNASIAVDAGTQLTAVGAFMDPTTTPIDPASLTKIGTGTLLLTNANSYAGSTFINEGILNAQTATALGVNTSTRQTVTLAGTTGSFTLGFSGPPSVTTGPIQISTLTVSTFNTALAAMMLDPNAPGGGTGTATASVGASGSVWTIFFGGSLTSKAVPLLTVQATVFNTSATVAMVQPGGASSVTVADGAALQLQSVFSFTEASYKPLTIAGAGTNGGGALENVSGNHTWDKTPITLADDTTIGADGTSTLHIANAVLGGTFGVTKVGAGTVSFEGAIANDYTGLTDVQGGKLLLAKTGGALAVGGDLSIGDTASDPAQLLTLSGYSAVAPDQFTLTFLGVPTAPIDYSSTANTLAINISSALNTILPVGSTVNVTPSAGQFLVTFGGSLSGTNPTLMTYSNVGAAGGAIAIVRAYTDLVQLQGDAQVVSTAAVTILGNGRLDVGTHAQTIASVDMTGGEISIGTGGNLTLVGALTAISDIVAPSMILGPGTLSLGSTPATFNVAPSGFQWSDLVVNAVITGNGLIKNNTGRLELGGVDTYGPTTVAAGDLLVDATGSLSGAVTLRGGSLSGKGSVAGIISNSVASPAAPANSINPGYNGTPSSTGILTSTGNVAWSKGTSFWVDLSSSSHFTPTAGADYDQLYVDGDVNLSNALLAGTVAANVDIGDTFTILQVTPGHSLTGTLDTLIDGVPTATDASGTNGFAFINGQTFKIVITTGLGGSVVLTRARDVITSFTITATPGGDSPATSIYGQQVVYTVSITLEPGATLHAGATMAFTLDASDSFTPYFGGANTILLTPSGNTGTGTYDPQTVNNLLWAVGDHTIDALFQDPSGNVDDTPYDNNNPFLQTVTAATTTIAAVNVATDFSTSDQQVYFSAIVTATPPTPVMTSPAPVVSEGTVTFTVMDGLTVIGSITSGILSNGATGNVQFTLPANTPVGTYTIVATYNPGPNFQINSDSTHTLKVNPALSVSSTTLPGGDVGVAYTRSITVQNGTKPYTTLTLGTSYNAHGTGLAAPIINLVAGTVTFNSTPNQAGTVDFTLTVIDSAGFVLNQPYSITISPAMTIAPAVMLGSDVGVLYNNVITLSNGTTPYTVLTVTPYSAGTTGLVAPTVDLAAGTVTFHSTPINAGTVTFTVTAQDSAGGTLVKIYSISIHPALSVTPATAIGGDVGVTYNRVLTVSGGTAPYTTFSITGYDDGNTGLLAPTLNAGLGTISFNNAPTQTGNVTFTLNVADSVGGTLTRNFTITINPALSITPSAPPADVGTLYNSVLSLANGTRPYTTLTIIGYTGGATGLAAPVVNASLGTITFNSTPIAAGVVTFSVNATDTAGGTLTKNYSITVNPRLAIAPATLIGADVGVLYTRIATVTGGSAPYTTFTLGSSYNAGVTGLAAPTLDPVAGTLTFNSTPTQAGSVTFTLSVTDSAGGTLTKNYTIAVNPPPTATPAALAPADVGTLYTRVATVTNGTAPYTTFALNGSFNPGTTGLVAPTLNAAAGTIAFNSTPTNTGAATFTINVIDSAGGTLNYDYTITVNSALTISPLSMPAGDAGTAYAQVITVGGGSSPLTALTVNPFSPGLTGLGVPTVDLAAGTVTFNSTPTTAGTVTFTVNATDTAGAVLTKNYSITINPPLTIAPATLIGADVGVLYTRSLTVTGGTSPYSTFTLNGSFDDHSTGLLAPTLNALAGTITFNSMPGNMGTATFTVTVTDPAGGVLTKNYSIVVSSPVSLSPTTLTGADVGVLYNKVIQATGGTTPYTTLSVSGFSAGGTGMITPTANPATGAVTFNTTPSAPGTANFTVNATDTAGGTVSQAYSIVVKPAMTIAPATLAPAEAGVVYTKLLAISNGTTPYTGINVGSFSAGGTGLAVPTADPVAGTLTFNSAPSQAGTVTFTVNATDTAGGTLTKNYTIAVYPALTITPDPLSLLGGDVGVLFNRVLTVNGGAPGTVLSSLTLGTTYNAGGTGLVPPAIVNTGTAHTITFNSKPAAVGTVTFTVTATDALGGVLTKAYSVVISPALAISPATMPLADALAPYTAVINLVNGTAPFTGLNITNFSAGATGVGPPTVDIAAGTATFNTTPTNAGIVTFMVNGTDSAGGTISKNYTITVNPPLVIAPAALPAGDVAKLYNSKITASGGSVPYTTFAVANFSAGGTGIHAPTVTNSAIVHTVVFGSTPTTPGIVSFDLNVVDSAGVSRTNHFAFTVYPVLTLTPTSIPAARYGTPYTQDISANNPLSNLTVTGFNVPGLTASADPVTGVVSVSGTPTGVPTTATFTATATDVAGAVLSRKYTFAITKAVADVTTNDVVATFSSAIQSLSMSAAVTSVIGVVNEGSVTFKVTTMANVQIGVVVTVPVVGGIASGNYRLPANVHAGTYKVVATYNPGVHFLGDSDAMHTLTVNKADSSIAAADATSFISSINHTVLLKATVTSSNGPVNQGTVTFQVMNGATPLGAPVKSKVVVNGAASVSYTLPPTLAVANYTIVATYNPGVDFLTSPVTMDDTHTLHIRNAVKLTLTSSKNPSFDGDAVTFTFKATSTTASVSALAGEVVTFKNKDTVLGTGIIDSTGMATIVISDLPIGISAITAVLDDDGTFSGGLVSMSQTVRKSTIVR